jgi:hypothetical protein
MIALFGAHYLQRVIGALVADVLPATRPRRCTMGLNLAFAPEAKLDCPDVFHNRLRLTPHSSRAHFHSQRQTRC